MIGSRSAGPPFDYHLFGLNIQSQLELPELPRAQNRRAPDVTITLGETGQEKRAYGPGLHSIDGGLLLVISNVASFLVRHGAEITVEPDSAVPSANLRLFLLGSAMGALLHQRGLLPLHANAIEVDGGAFAFSGPSGVGKSTLAAWFHDLGFRIIGDDVCVVRIDHLERPIVSAGLPRLRLRTDALLATGRSPSAFNPSYVSSGSPEKFDVPIEYERRAAQSVLRATYFLSDGPKFEIVELAEAEAFESLVANMYRGHFANIAGTMRASWQTCVKLARSVPAYRVTRTRRLDSYDQETREILGHLRNIIAAAA